MIGSCPTMLRVRKLIERVAPTDASALVLGESGTGKELVARAIHDGSGRRPLVTVNCASLNDNLLESELFGHERGAFSGAVQAHKGCFERAAGGTLFLDEVGDMSPAMQAKLLRAIQHGEFTRVGGERSVYAQVRVIAATNKDLASEVRAKRFREDLFYRINVITITLPPLRERGADVDDLAAFFLQGRAIDEKALLALRAYPWPGNVRELEHTVKRACILADGAVEVEDLQLPVVRPKSTLVEGEKAAILEALEASGWVQAEAAKRLGLSARNLHYRLVKYDIKHPSWWKRHE